VPQQLRRPCHNSLRQGGRREEFAFVDGLEDGEFLEEVFVNAAKEIAAGAADSFAVEGFQQRSAKTVRSKIV
jgi:hypothetical protein